MKKNAWQVMRPSEQVALDEGDVLAIAFTSTSDANCFRERTNPSGSVSEQARRAIVHLLAHRVRCQLRADEVSPEPRSGPRAGASRLIPPPPGP